MTPIGAVRSGRLPSRPRHEGVAAPSAPMFPFAPFPGVSGTSRRRSRCARCPISRGFWNMALERAPDTDSPPITSCRGRFSLESLESQALPHSMTNLISPYTASTSQAASRRARRIRGATSALPYAAFRRGHPPRHTRSPWPVPAAGGDGRAQAEHFIDEVPFMGLRPALQSLTLACGPGVRRSDEMESAKQRERTRRGHRGGREPRAFILSTGWRTGPRTCAWDELWRWLLAPELDPSASAVTRGSSDPERERGR